MAIATVVGSAGCRITAKNVADSQRFQDYDRLEIIYRAHPASGTMFSCSPPAKVQSSIIQTAAEMLVEAAEDSLSWSKAELRIECPHPDGRTHVARVTLHLKPVDCGQHCENRTWERQREDRIGSRQCWRATLRQRWFYEPTDSRELGETYFEMELPREELNRVIDELNNHGFFSDRGRKSDVESQLEVRLNRRWTSRCWVYEPSLDALTTRAYECGSQRTNVIQKP